MGVWGLFQFVTCHILTHKKQKDAKIRIWNQKKVRNLRKDVYHQNAWQPLLLQEMQRCGLCFHETGARHKSLEEHNRELHRENKSLEEELETKRRAVKGLTTMIENLTRRQEEIQSQIAELEAQQQESDSNKEDILRQIKFLNQTLTEIRINLREKRGKLD